MFCHPKCLYTINKNITHVLPGTFSDKHNMQHGISNLLGGAVQHQSDVVPNWVFKEKIVSTLS